MIYNGCAKGSREQRKHLIRDLQSRQKINTLRVQPVIYDEKRRSERVRQKG